MKAMEQCVALADYDALGEDEISFHRGDVINVTAKGSASGYWEGFVVHRAASKGQIGASNSNCGLFPNCLVSSNLRPQLAPTFCDKALCLYDYKAIDASEMSFAKGDLIAVLRPGTSRGWWYGVNESATERMTARDEKKSLISEVCGTQAAPLLFPSNFVTCKIVSVAFCFQARLKYELLCDLGDIIQVHRQWNDGWWEGTLKGRRGIFPSNYTLPNVATTSPPFFCNVCKTVFSDSPLVCDTCHNVDKITESMITALDDYSSKKLSHMDLFAYVDVESVGDTGGKSLSIAAAAEGSIRRTATMTMTNVTE